MTFAPMSGFPGEGGAQETSMKRIILLAAAAAIAVTATPALAKTKKKQRVQQGYYGETYVPFGYWAGYGAPVAGISARCVLPHLRHSSVHTWRRLSRRCGSIRTMRVVPPHVSHWGPARIFCSEAVRVMDDRMPHHGAAGVNGGHVPSRVINGGSN